MNWLKEMNELAEGIKELELKVASLYKLRHELERSIATWESEQLSRLTQEVNPDTGKLRFPSDSARRAEVERLKQESEDVKRLQEELQRVLDELSVTRIELNYRQELLKNLRTFLRYQAVVHDDSTTVKGKKLTRRK